MTEKAILYIDDAEGDLVLMELYMHDRNLNVDGAHTLKKAIDSFDPQRHFLSIIDWNLHDTNGAEAAQALRIKSTGLPVIFLSGSYTQDRLAEAALIKPLACLEKSTSMQYMDEIASIANELLK